jgi:hypothetical protein
MGVEKDLRQWVVPSEGSGNLSPLRGLRFFPELTQHLRAGLISAAPPALRFPLRGTIHWLNDTAEGY